MRMSIWPRTLANRTLLLLLLGLAAVQATGLLIHALDRLELQDLANGRYIGTRAVLLYRTIVTAPDRDLALRDMDTGPMIRANLDISSQRAMLAQPADAAVQRLVRPYLSFSVLPQNLRPREVLIRGGWTNMPLVIAMRLPDDRWLDLRVKVPPPRPWHSDTFLAAFAGMTLAAALLSGWAVRRLTAPVRTLAAAADALGRDVNAPALPETGPQEVATAAHAFNTMAGRIRRFVTDRTSLLTAIGHDLRTPITRLKLRAEWMEDEEQRRKMLADLDELEAMVAATLAFGRDASAQERAVPLDLASLVRTVLDEAADANPDKAEHLAYAGPEHLPVKARPIALKRALANLVSNALAYGGAARAALQPSTGDLIAVTVDDDGPGIPPDSLDRVFEPFLRLEPSRNRETGGTGLGLSIARNILRAHGGDVSLTNRPGGGLRATLLLPA